MHTSPPLPSEYDPYFGRYIALVSEDAFAEVLAGQPATYQARLGGLSAEQAGFRYAPGKWSVREVLGHVIDTERVFGYRALCIARGETASLPGFDENVYAAHAGHDRATLPALLEELRLVRQGHLLMLAQLDRPAWERAGTVKGHPLTVRGLGYLIVGHAQHHLGVLADRYAAVLP
jgi:hypothetical protein